MDNWKNFNDGIVHGFTTWTSEIIHWTVQFPLTTLFLILNIEFDNNNTAIFNQLGLRSKTSVKNI